MNTLIFLCSHLFSLRLLVVLAAVVFALAGEQLEFLSWADRVFLGLMGAPDAGNGPVPIPLGGMSNILAARALSEPLWTDLAMGIALVGSSFYLAFAVPRMGVAVALPVTLLLGGSLVVLQAALTFYRNEWLPLGEVITLLVAGFVVMLFWLQPNREIRSLESNVQEARLQLARLLLQQGNTDEAVNALQGCPTCDAALELRYDIAIQQERKRQYEKAIASYGHILEQRKNFRDASERLSALEKLSTESALVQPSGFDSTRTLLMPEQSLSRPTLGRYEIERELGRGAMGVVFLGKDPKIARTVAIKTLSYQAFDDGHLPELKERFFREAEAAGRLDHPSIVTVYDVGEEADLAYIAMDYAQGRPLSDFGKPGRLLPLPTVLEIIARAADALAYAHSKKVVHRDIKPGNIIYNPNDGAIKITDFGIAKISDDSRTKTGSVMGSPLYMSPEQLKGQKVTGASDIYSLGVTLYKLVSGATPYQGDTLANLTYQILNKRPRSVREFNAELPNGVVRLINKAIQREPDKRFASAATMAEAVRRLAVREAREVSS
ncbi:serine/threonine protein kinase [Marinobacter alexandrii]|uniref:serine/threonine-protein kinase n=1 Tax=Marinobacter alexandrii TaxID=2570351 RepID=UPI001D1986C2|nr:serine/threonine-protein kinase [Marinobacter alexandrii]MCK2149395.1 serine/threonine protein kinase [Marinobacter alexandrii]